MLTVRERTSRRRWGPSHGPRTIPPSSISFLFPTPHTIPPPAALITLQPTRRRPQPSSQESPTSTPPQAAFPAHPSGNRCTQIRRARILRLLIFSRPVRFKTSASRSATQGLDKP